MRSQIHECRQLTRVHQRGGSGLLLLHACIGWMSMYMCVLCVCGCVVCVDVLCVDVLCVVCVDVCVLCVYVDVWMCCVGVGGCCVLFSAPSSSLLQLAFYIRGLVV